MHRSNGQRKKGFKCTPCDIKSTGTFWSADGNQVHNTCTLDNLTTGVTLHAEQHGQGLLKEMKGSPNEEHFRRIIDHNIRGNFAEGQKIWYEEVVVPRHTKDVDDYEKRKKEVEEANKDRIGKGLPELHEPQRPIMTEGSLYGSLHHKTYSNLQDASTFEMTKNCNDCGTSTRKVTSLSVEDIQAIANPTTSICTRCKKGTCTQEFHNPHGKQNWLLHVDADGMEVFAPLDLMDNLNDTVKIDNRDFKKQTITFYNDEIGGGHFVSAQKYKGDWVWYDGMKSDSAPMDSKRIRKLTEDGTFALQY